MEYSTSKWTGKKIVTFGDSITWYDGQTFIPSHREGGQIAVGYQPYIRKHECYVLPVCDWYYESGINDITKSAYMGDDDTLPYTSHPTNSGFGRMAGILIPFLEAHY